MAAESKTAKPKAPDQIPLTALQSERLSAISGLSAKELVGLRPVDLADKLKWRVDPLMWRYQRVCGRVVKRDPVTGIDYGVPNATVHVEDTDCSLLHYAPIGSPFSWYYPFKCRREVIATVHTDSCGRFCVWIPRWEIDWILTWRAQRICFRDIFERPTRRDLIPIPEPPERFPFPFPKPGPGPDPVDLRNRLVPRLRELGDRVMSIDALDMDAFEENLQPPLPKEFTGIVGDKSDKHRSGETHELVRSSIAMHAGIDPKALASFDLRNVIGPFRRCVDVFTAVWTPIVDVPDITFRVTQDVDGDGDQETIYSESYFQVRWDATNIPDVTLHASSWARESRICDAPPPLPCVGQPAINFAGLMPVTASYHNNGTGYAIKPNRPRPAGVPTSPATAPYCLNVNLFGCLPNLPGATKYRLKYRYAPTSGGSFTAAIPFTNAQWYWHPLGGPPVHAIPTPTTGWYDLPPAGLAGTPEESFLFPFDTIQFVPGLYGIVVELGNSGGATVGPPSAEVFFMCDNRAPTILNQIRWSANNGGTWTILPTDCPVVRRGTLPHDVLFEVTWTIMAPAHYRESSTDSAGCGASGNAAALDPLGQTTTDWHTGPNDNAITYTLTYRLPSGNAEGTYSFGSYAGSRAFNPSGYVAGYQTFDWLYDVGSPPIYNSSRVYFSVINA